MPGKRRTGRTKADETVEAGGETDLGKRHDRVWRDREMYAEWRSGIDYATIADRHSNDEEAISPRRVQQICDEAQAEGIETMEYDDPLAGLHDVDRLLVQLDDAATKAALLYEAAFADKNYAAAVGAHRRMAEARRELLELKQLRGIVPRNMAALTDQWSGVQLVERILEVFRRHNIPDEIGREVTRAGRFRTREDRGHLELDMRPGCGVSRDEAGVER